MATVLLWLGTFFLGGAVIFFILTALNNRHNYRLWWYQQKPAAVFLALSLVIGFCYLITTIFPFVPWADILGYLSLVSAWIILLDFGWTNGTLCKMATQEFLRFLAK